MVPYLLNILEGRLDVIDNPATTKAQIVKALKAMTKSLLLGEKVNAILEKSSVWAEYKDQRHDLFISNASNSGYLTGKDKILRSVFTFKYKYKYREWKNISYRLFTSWNTSIRWLSNGRTQYDTYHRSTTS